MLDPSRQRFPNNNNSSTAISPRGYLSTHTLTLNGRKEKKRKSFNIPGPPLATTTVAATASSTTTTSPTTAAAITPSITPISIPTTPSTTRLPHSLLLLDDFDDFLGDS